MIKQFFRANCIDRRNEQQVKIERLQELTRQAKDLRSRGQTSKANNIELEAKKLKRELGIKTEDRPLTPEERVRKKLELKQKLKARKA